MSAQILSTPTDAIEPTPEPEIHALHSSWSTPECGAGPGSGWARASYVGGVTCPDCLYALPAWAANEAMAVAS